MDIRHPILHPPVKASRYRWLNVVGLFMFIGLTLYANQEDAAAVKDVASDSQQEVVSIAEVPADTSIYGIIKDASTKHDLDPKLIATIIYVESRGRAMAVSPRGAKGLMQLTPVVYKHYGVNDPFDMDENIHVGTAYLASLLKRFNGNLEHALAAYNCGPSQVREHNGLPPIKETRDYVRRVMRFYLHEEVPIIPANQES